MSISLVIILMKKANNDSGFEYEKLKFNFFKCEFASSFVSTPKILDKCQSSINFSGATFPASAFW